MKIQGKMKLPTAPINLDFHFGKLRAGRSARKSGGVSSGISPSCLVISSSHSDSDGGSLRRRRKPTRLSILHITLMLTPSAKALRLRRSGYGALAKADGVGRGRAL